MCTDVDTRDCTREDAVRESALEVDCERKIPRSTGDSKPRQYCAWLFSRTVTNRAIPAPIKLFTTKFHGCLLYSMEAHYFVDFCFHSLLGGGVGWRGGGGGGGFF